MVGLIWGKPISQYRRAKKTKRNDNFRALNKFIRQHSASIYSGDDDHDRGHQVAHVLDSLASGASDLH